MIRRARAVVRLACGLVAMQASAGALAADPSSPTDAAQARVHAQDVADIYRDACVQTRADPAAAAAWAKRQGFVTSTASGRELAGFLTRRGEQGQVFSRGPRDESVLLVTTRRPSSCLVMGLQTVDGRRLRARMQATVAEWTGIDPPPPPTMVSPFDEGGPHATITYLAVSGNDRYRLMVISPDGVARGVVIMGISHEPR